MGSQCDTEGGWAVRARIMLYRPASLRSDPGRLRLAWVATLLWSTWQASRGLGGSFPLDWMAGFPWTGWQPSHGLGGNLPMEWVAGSRGICRLVAIDAPNGPATRTQSIKD